MKKIEKIRLKKNNEYAKRNEVTVVGEYIDKVKSRTTDNRPEFQE